MKTTALMYWAVQRKSSREKMRRCGMVGGGKRGGKRAGRENPGALYSLRAPLALPDRCWDHPPGQSPPHVRFAPSVPHRAELPVSHPSLLAHPWGFCIKAPHWMQSTFKVTLHSMWTTGPTTWLVVLGLPQLYLLLHFRIIVITQTVCGILDSYVLLYDLS